MRADWLIVGAGFTGCTLAERIATQLGQRVVLMDRRQHIGGNAYDVENADGILVHLYGPHIFHTNSTKVWDYLSQFTGWRPYEHHVQAVINGKHVPLPFNLNSIAASFPAHCAAPLCEKLIAQYGLNSKVPILRLRESSDAALQDLAEYIYHNVFYNYTLKQWGLTPEQLDPSVTGRVPVRVNYDDRYFEDVYQAMPAPSYSAMFERMLNHPNIEVMLGTNYLQNRQAVQFDRLIFTGPIDEYFEYLHGALPYRSLRFEFETVDQARYQPVGTVNFPNGERYTRITEQKHITGQVHPRSTIIREFPQAYDPASNEPYYPIPREDNRTQYDLYLNEAAKLNGKVLFAGRLADYRYYNMDQAVARALKVFEEIV